MNRILTYNISDNLITNIAELIDKDYIQKNKDLDKIAFVFGGKRPSLFLKKEISLRIKKAFLSPNFFSMDEFIKKIVLDKMNLRHISQIESCYKIYTITKKIYPNILRNKMRFSEFMPWSLEILSLIEQIDLENICSINIKNIEQNAKLGYDVPETINELLKNIYEIRKLFNKELKDNNFYTRGMLYLLASRLISDESISEYEHIYFCNLFYLHSTEKTIIKKIYEINKAILVFQGHESQWSILKEHTKTFSFTSRNSNDTNAKYKLNLYAGQDAHSQASIISEIIKDISDLSNTVIVVPEPENIMPLLSEINTKVKEYNISLGYPIRRSSVYTLLENIFKSQITKKENKYYAKDYLNLVTHPFVKNLKIIDDHEVTRVIIHKIEEILTGMQESDLSGNIFIKISEIENCPLLYDITRDTLSSLGKTISLLELKAILIELHKVLFYNWENIRTFEAFSNSLQKTIEVIVKKSFIKSYPLNIKVIEKILSISEELGHSSFNKEKFDFEEIINISQNIMANEIISFVGSPLKGMQILGVMESRALSFDNVIIADMNENIFPKLKIQNPLIPRDVMIGLGINRLEKEDEIQRYQFKRLISCAKNVHLVYREDSKSARSRFIEELIWEYQKNNKSLKKLPVKKFHFNIKMLNGKKHIGKNAYTIDLIKNMNLSPTRIDTYLSCPMRFYFQYILCIKEKRNVIEEFDGAKIGTFMHNFLNRAYSKYIGKEIRIKDDFKSEFQKILDDMFNEEFKPEIRFEVFLIKDLIDYRMRRFLLNESLREDVAIESLEKSFNSDFKIKDIDFKFNARIDRIDRVNHNKLLILDYKTGGENKLPKKLELMSLRQLSRIDIKKNVGSFQLPVYLMMLRDTYKIEDIDVAIYNLREAKIVNLFKNEDIAEKEKILQTIKSALDFIICEMVNIDIPFIADESEEIKCKNCPYSYACR